MAAWIDRKFINYLSPYLRNFKWSSDTTARCSCPVCGDSKTNKFKTRFFFIQRDNNYTCFCHNCGYSNSLRGYLKEYNHAYYTEYLMDNLRERVGNKSVAYNKDLKNDKQETFTSLCLDPLTSLDKISELSDEHPGKLYCTQRLIPSNKLQLIYYSSAFTDWVNTWNPNKFTTGMLDENRIILPFFSSKTHEFFGCSARTILNKEPRYYNILLEQEEDCPKFFGYDRVDTTREYCLVEGSIDSLFVDNCAAMNTLAVNLKQIKNKENCIIALDNQPRHKEVVKTMARLASNGFNICIWPEDIKEKDVNQMVIAGLDPNSIIYNNVYSGLAAKLKLVKWSKI